MKRVVFFLILIFIISSIETTFGQSKSKSRIWNKNRTKSKAKKTKKLRWQKVHNNSFNTVINKIDVGVNIGTANSLTDIGGTKTKRRPAFMDMQMSETKLSYGVFGRYRYSPYYSFNAGINYCKISGDDKLSPETSSRYKRNFKFQNHILEFSGRAELYITTFIFGEKTPISMKRYFVPFECYAFLGIGAYKNNPTLYIQDETQIKSTTIKDDNNFQFTIPMGVGTYYTINKDWRVGYEVGYRKLFNDYLDGFTRSYSKGNDCYVLSSFSVSYLIPLKVKHRSSKGNSIIK